MVSSNLNNRIKAFDFIKCFAIFLVIWGHVIQHLYKLDYNDQPIYRVIYSFHMSLFMMISGYFSVSSMRLYVFEFIKKKCKQLILPCVTWSIIWWGAYSLLHSLLGHQAFSFDLLTNSLLRHFWFLKCLFLCYLLYYGCSKICNSFSFVLALFIVICQFVNIYNLPQMSICFAFGLIIKRKPYFMDIVKRYNFIFGVAFLIMLIFWNNDISSNRFDALSQFDYIIRGGTINLYELFCESYRITLGLFGSLFIIGFGLSTIKNDNNSIFIEKMSNYGQYTLGIYLFQSILLEAALKKYVYLNMMGIMWFNIAAPFISIIIFMISVLIIKNIKKSSEMSFLLLGS